MGPSSLEYRRTLPHLIRSWRIRWAEGPFSFYVVTPAGFGSKDGTVVEEYSSKHGISLGSLPWIREGASCVLTLPATGIALADDLGFSREQFPLDKLVVARRLALLARHRLYGEKIVDTGPVFRDIKIEGNKARVEFNTHGGVLTLGISPSESDGELPTLAISLKGFALAGSNHRWFSAQGHIEGDSVILSSDAVPHPEAVRYNWKDFPEGNLYNREGLPTLSFRSDTDQPVPWNKQ